MGLELNSPRKKPIQRRSRETVRAVLQAAAYILVEEGHERATTNAIAERAGVNIGSLYQYFPNKNAIFAAVSAEHFRDYGAHMLAMSQRSFEEPLLRSLRLMVQAHVGFCVQHRSLARALLLYALSDGASSPIADTRRALSHTFALYLASRPRAELRPRDTKQAAHVTVLVVDALTQDALLSGVPRTEGELSRQIADVLEPYLVAKPTLRLARTPTKGRSRAAAVRGKPAR